MSQTSILSFVLQEGEGYKIEFKEKIADLDREIVAFANASGGSIFLGVADDSTIKGIHITNLLKSQVVDIAHNCDPSLKVGFVNHSDENILEVQISEGVDKPYRCKDGFFLRVGPNSQKLKRDEIVSLIHDSGKIRFDEAFNHLFDYTKDFSKEALSEFLKYCGITTKLSATDILINLSVAEKKNHKLIFTNTGVLFFAKDPQKFYPESYITLVRYASQDRFSIMDKQEIKGGPIHQIEQSMNFILRNISVETNLALHTNESLARRENQYDYPLLALRESIVNAVAHRDYYYDGSHIFVHIYPDHIDIENPGGLCHGLTLDALGKRSVRRNRLVADLLHRANYIERVGSGFDRMKRELDQNNNPPLEVNATNFFNIRFYKRIRHVAVNDLTLRQVRLYQLCQERKSLTKREAAFALNVSEDTAIRELNTLLKLRLIKKMGKGRAIRYQDASRK